MSRVPDLPPTFTTADAKRAGVQFRDLFRARDEQLGGGAVSGGSAGLMPLSRAFPTCWRAVQNSCGADEQQERAE